MPSPKNKRIAADWLVGDSAMVELIRSMDWSATPLGSRVTWSQSLRTVVNLILSSSFPMSVLWGDDLVFIYNDAYRVIAADKHPAAMGRSTRDVWPEVWEFNRPIFESVMFRGETVHLEDQLFRINRQGAMEEAYFTLSYSPIRTDANQVAGTLVVLIETTNRVLLEQQLEHANEDLVTQLTRQNQTEEALRQSEERFRALTMASSDAVYRMSPDWSEMRQLDGRGFIRDTEHPDRNWLQVYIHPDDQPRVLAAIHEAIRDRCGFELEHRVLRVDGTLGWTFSRAIPLLDATGEIVEWFGAAGDITERKRADEALRQSEARLSLALDSGQMGLWQWDVQANRAVWNAKEYQVLGLPIGNGLEPADRFFQCVHPDDLPALKRSLARLMKGGSDWHEECRITDPDGQVRWIAAVGRLFRDTSGQPVQMIGVNYDITEHKKTEAVLRQSELEQRRQREFLECLIANAGSCIAVVSGRELRYTFANPAFQLFAGEVPMVGRTYAEVFPEAAESGAEALIQRVLETGEPWILDNYRAPVPGKPDATWEGAVVRLPLVSGQEPSALAVVWDITERIRVETALQQSEGSLSQAQRVGHVGSWEWDLNTGNVRWSAELYSIYGLNPSSFDPTIQSFSKYVHPDDRNMVDEVIQHAVIAGGPVDFEFRILRADGSIRILNTKGEVTAWDEHGKPRLMVGTNQDVTERKRAEEELFKLNKTLEDRVAERTAEAEQRALQLRQLAAELTLAEQRERQRISLVLHDGLQQILVAAKFHIALLGKNKDIANLTSELAEMIDDGIETSRTLASELSPPILRQGGLVPALEWLVGWMRDRYGLTIRLASHGRIESAPEEVVILLFQSVRELLFNVVKHAGTRTARVEIMQEAGRIRVDVEDEGVGFDPTQLNESGTRSKGMGLFGIQERLSYLGGSMEIESAPGRGSRFKLVTPPISMKTAVSPIHEQSIVSVSIASQREAPLDSAKSVRVVLVDDHMVMRQGLAGLLRAEPDIEVIGEASDGQSAIDLIRELRPNVVLMDISMPGMDGIQATRIIHKELPETRIIGLSMFQEEEQQATMREAGAVEYLTKTGPAEALVEAIRACVRGSEEIRVPLSKREAGTAF